MKWAHLMVKDIIKVDPRYFRPLKLKLYWVMLVKLKIN